MKVVKAKELNPGDIVRYAHIDMPFGHMIVMSKSLSAISLRRPFCYTTDGKINFEEVNFDFNSSMEFMIMLGEPRTSRDDLLSAADFQQSYSLKENPVK